MPEKIAEVLVVGAGPAGIAAACCASEAGCKVVVLDDNPSPGGQIWRRESRRSSSPQAVYWFDRLRRSRAEVVCGVRMVGEADRGALLVDHDDCVSEIPYGKLILATGARERFLPFPGWTLPNVMGAGGLQAMVKGGLPIEGRSVAIAGSGPLLLAVASYLKKMGAQIMLVAEQARSVNLMRFGFHLIGEPAKLREAFELRWGLGGIRYRTACWPIAAEGNGRLESVTFSNGRTNWKQRCDYLACGFGLVPNLEVPLLLGCENQNGAVKVDSEQQTTVAGIFCAGETTGVGGLDLALAEGQIAGYAAAGRPERAREFSAARAKGLRFRNALDRAFTLREELRTIVKSETLVCRCEDVAFETLLPHPSWRAAKLQTRCGMGPCQGRVCGPAADFLFGWKAESVRPPILPTSLGRLASVGEPNPS
jgi:NADPH-dependent 2,4-dienoyl-CoA reductase/sulfur reductase-like enzyme